MSASETAVWEWAFDAVRIVGGSALIMGCLILLCVWSIVRMREVASW